MTPPNEQPGRLVPIDRAYMPEPADKCYRLYGDTGRALAIQERIQVHIEQGPQREAKALKEALRRDLSLFRLILRVLEHGL